MQSTQASISFVSVCLDNNPQLNTDQTIFVWSVCKGQSLLCASCSHLWERCRDQFTLQRWCHPSVGWIHTQYHPWQMIFQTLEPHQISLSGQHTCDSLIDTEFSSLSPGECCKRWSKETRGQSMDDSIQKSRSMSSALSTRTKDSEKEALTTKTSFCAWSEWISIHQSNWGISAWSRTWTDRSDQSHFLS